jgi:toluene monooxygenase electron transfer component
MAVVTMLNRMPSIEHDVGLATVNVETKTGTFSYVCSPNETLLAAGLAAGFSLPYECATGTCGTCHARVMDGPVDSGWPDAPAYRSLRRDKGDVLMCQARPLGDCSLRVKSNVIQPDEPTVRLLQRRGRIDVVRPLTKDVVHIEIALSQPMNFAAGQFVTIQHASLIGRRAYSMVNFGRDVDRLSFVIKRKLGGEFSRIAFEENLLGADLDVLGPLGRATFRPEEDRDVLCIAGGSGIAGMMAILQHATEDRYFNRHRGHVFFGVRTLSDAFYLEDFAKHLAAADAGLDVTVAFSDENEVPPLHPDFERIRLATGMVHDVVARTLVAGQWTNAIGFVAGPQPMVDSALRILITQTGLGTGNIRFDKFS